MLNVQTRGYVVVTYSAKREKYYCSIVDPLDESSLDFSTEDPSFQDLAKPRIPGVPRIYDFYLLIQPREYQGSRYMALEALRKVEEIDLSTGQPMKDTAKAS